MDVPLAIMMFIHDGCSVAPSSTSVNCSTQSVCRNRMVRSLPIMKSLIKNTVVDEANEVTYVINAERMLTDGEIYSAIRVAWLARGRKIPAKGETLEIAWSGRVK